MFVTVIVKAAVAPLPIVWIFGDLTIAIAGFPGFGGFGGGSFGGGGASGSW